MKTLIAGIHSYKTTVIGIGAALLATLDQYEVVVLAPWVIPACIAMWAVVARDADVSSEDSGV